MNEVVKNMQETYTDIKNLNDHDVKNYNGWKGKQKEEMATFLDLCLQFHKDLCEGGGNPTERFLETLKEMSNSVYMYTSDSSSYKKMKGVW